MLLDINSAIEELTHTSEAKLEYETAVKWASRAAAAYRLARLVPGKARHYYQWAKDLEHEALEHAALVKDYGRTVMQVQKAIKAKRDDDRSREEPPYDGSRE
jgi:hypothetical protein